MKELKFSIFKIGFIIYARTFWKWREFYFPGLSVAFANIATQRQIDFEIKILCFGIGVKLFKKK